MSLVRPPISQSISLPATSSSNLVSRAPKRRLASTPELEFFTPAASSFNPRPYAPHAPSPSESFPRPASLVRNHGRPLEPHALPPAGMDPQPTDPNVVFVHPPFTTFPNSQLHRDGLSYQLMADNPEWFLDADDFVSQHNPNARAIPYPPHLEPPRGWCPAKKKDLRDRGPEGWPEGEEPRLRCTFCRRTYAGVNAKSMWRRHVFEKHKIAMSNRRDGSERPRGRGSNKENKQVSSKHHHQSHDSIISMSVAPHTEPRNVSHKSKFRSLLPIPPDEFKRRNSMRDKIGTPIVSASRGTREGSLGLGSEDGPTRRHQLLRPHIPPLSPPLTPQASSSSDNPVMESESSILATSPLPLLRAVPQSPYDPLLTPSFRHSPPRLPSDQPWRFPSPSHPLHSRSRELSLSMLIRNMESPNHKSSPIIGESLRLLQTSPAPSPLNFNSIRSKRNYLDLETPESIARLPRPSPRALFSRGRISLPTEYHSPHKLRYRIEESPLRRTLGTTSKTHKLVSSELTDDWLSASSLTPSTSSLDTLELLGSTDPFVIMYPPWESIEGRQTNTQVHANSPDTSSEAESPVLRNGTLTSGVGLGIGLLGPFSLPDDDLIRTGDESDFDEILTYSSPTDEEGDEVEVATFLADRSKNCVEDVPGIIPPLKKRKLTTDYID